MAKFFRFFPKTIYSLDGKNTDAISKLTSRFSFEPSYKDNASVYYKYDVQDSDTPEIIADKLYGSPERHWIILMMNNIVDPQFDWPLDQRTLLKFIEQKYKPMASVGQTGLVWSKSNIKTYYKIIERKSNTPTEDSLVTKMAVTLSDYNAIANSSEVVALPNGRAVTIITRKESLSHFDYEMEENEKKRTIKLLKPEFVAAVEEEFRAVAG
jgi:hypothetical protein